MTGTASGPPSTPHRRTPLVVVPAYRPDGALPALVRDLAERGLPDVLVVDDGSGPAHAAVFDAAAALGAEVLRHDRNRGKGVALRTAFAHARERHPGRDVVTADADGQHTPASVRAVADRLSAGGADVVVGERDLTGAGVPLRSRVGNALSGAAVRTATGLPVRDSQTGLRGLAAGTLPWLLDVPGDRYEYELRVLLEASARGAVVAGVPVETVYVDDNASSHFRPVRDSLVVMAPLLAFAASGLLAFGVDAAALLALQAATGILALAVVGARVLSAAVNFGVNRALVFGRSRPAPVRGSAARYAALALLLLAANYGLLDALHGTLGVPLLVAKALTDAALFLASWTVQRQVVFAPSSADRGPDDGAGAGQGAVVGATTVPGGPQRSRNAAR
ncbi:glycosyltransferase [Isoptericola sp. NPDC057653]|uniref:glycosyltransferase n=1 Tax=Isoptericola sp. NPDC057653 TaxID=3346195 RepID=UPI0036AA102E